MAVPLVGCWIACSLVPTDSWVPVHWNAAWEANRWEPGAEFHKYLWLIGGVAAFCNFVEALVCTYTNELAAFNFPPPTEQDIRRMRIVIAAIAAVAAVSAPIVVILIAWHALGG